MPDTTRADELELLRQQKKIMVLALNYISENEPTGVPTKGELGLALGRCMGAVDTALRDIDLIDPASEYADQAE